MNDDKLNNSSPASGNQPAPRKSRGKRIALITGGILLIGAVAAGAGVSGHCRNGDHMGRAIDRVSDELELNAEQRQKLEELGAVMKQARQSMKDGTGIETVLGSVKGASLDREALSAMVNEKLDRARAQAPQVIAALGNFYDGLDASQQAEAREKLRWMADKVESRGHHDDD